MKKSYYVGGYKPAYSKKANEFLKAMDLGIEGVFYPFIEIAILTFKDDATQENFDNAPKNLKSAYEHLGFTSITVIEKKD